jgi:hypothetical protein
MVSRHGERRKLAKLSKWIVSLGGAEGFAPSCRYSVLVVLRRRTLSSELHCGCHSAYLYRADERELEQVPADKFEKSAVTGQMETS